MIPTGEIPTNNLGSESVPVRDFEAVPLPIDAKPQQGTSGIQDGTMPPMSPEEMWDLQSLWLRDKIPADSFEEGDGRYTRKPITKKDGGTGEWGHHEDTGEERSREEQGKGGIRDKRGGRKSDWE